MSRARRIMLALLVVTLVAAGGGWWWFETEVVPELDERIAELRSFRPLTVCQVLDSDGVQFDNFYIERRVWVPLSEVAPVMRQAVISAEDRRFYEHPGVDLLGIARAAFANAAAGEIVEGGSTLSQQVVKNLVVGSERSYRRKLVEAGLAWRLERQLSKDEILELYLNLVYLGSGNYGVEAASNDYFAVSASELDIGQAALLAGLIPAPSRYSPRQDPDTAMVRRGLVLRAMRAEGYISIEEAWWAALQPIDPVVRIGEDGGVGTAYATIVRREVRRLLGTQLPVQHGLIVRTAYDPGLQAVAERAVARAAADLEERQGLDGPRRRLATADIEPWLATAAGLPRDPEDLQPVLPEVGGCFPAVLPARPRDPVRAGPFELRLDPGEWQQRVRSLDSETASKPLGATRPAGEIWSVCLQEDGEVALERQPWVQGAAVVIENATSRVVALTGGRSMPLEGFVRATQARRQPGSSFKPYVYAAALLAGYSPQTLVLDAPLSLPAGGGRYWSPKNYSAGYAGRLPLADALARSLNTVAVRLAMDTGPAAMVDVARRLGVRTPLRSDLTVALGSSEVTPYDQAVAMASIARMGVATQAHVLLDVSDMSGRTEGTAGGPVVIEGKTVAFLPGGSGERVLPGGVASAMVEMLGGVVERGTGRRARDPDQPRIGKTGTTNDFVDAWFVGATPTHTIAVWIGTDAHASLGKSETGGRAALPAWIEIADALPKGPDIVWPVPDDAVRLPTARGVVSTSRTVPARELKIDPGIGVLPPWPASASPSEAPTVGPRPEGG